MKFSWEIFSPSLYWYSHILHLFRYFVTCSRLGVSRQTVQTLCHPRPVQLYTVYTPGILWRGPGNTGRGHASHATDVEKRMILDTGSDLSDHLGHWTFQSRCRDHSVSGHRTDIGLNGPNLIIVMRPDSPCQDFRHTSIWFLTFSLKWCYNHLTWWWLLWHHCYCNHIEPLLLIILIQLCFTFRWIGRWWG